MPYDPDDPKGWPSGVRTLYRKDAKKARQYVSKPLTIAAESFVLVVMRKKKGRLFMNMRPLTKTACSATMLMVL